MLNRTTDGNANVGSTTVTVSLTPLNDETPSCSSAAYTATEDEAQAIGTAITLSPAFSCTDVDVDSDDKITYTMSGNSIITHAPCRKSTQF